MGLEVGANGVERLGDPLLERDRVEVVDQQQAGDHPVVREPLAQAGGLGAGVVERADDPAHALAIELDHRPDQGFGSSPRTRVGDLVELLLQLLDPRDQLGPRRSLRSWPRARSSQHMPVGVCWTLRTWPLPVYMWTPHGRHGSKLRTARMMSTPLKFSGPFSSKIGVFCTASS